MTRHLAAAFSNQRQRKRVGQPQRIDQIFLVAGGIRHPRERSPGQCMNDANGFGAFRTDGDRRSVQPTRLVCPFQ
jgi:hypothetical protein